MPPKGKRTAANQHDKRHENGLAPPGKRIQKQKSNPALNGHTNGKPPPPTPPLPSADVNPVDTLPAAVTERAHGPQQDSRMAGNMPGGGGEPRGRTSSEASLEALEGYAFESSNASDPASASAQHRADAGGIKPASAYRGNVFTLTTTILSSCPLRDVIAILIILLQLPPTVLTIVHFLFATLTFVPPQTGTSLSALSALPSLTDMFQGSGGTPSLFTIFVTDIIILLFWLLMWVPMQNIFLDLAQAVIAISLGGAAAGKGGTTNSVFLCVSIILLSHVFRWKPLPQYLLYFLRTGMYDGGSAISKPPSSHEYRDSLNVPHGWFRSLLGIHILSQGIVRMVRRSLSRRESSQTNPIGKKVDPEAAVAPQLPRRRSTSIDSNNEVPSSSSTDGRPPGPSPALPKEKSLSGKMKRRQATHVRSRQPFWAALASTKVTVLKEMEQSLAANDAAEANARDANHIGNADIRAGEDRVWITNIGATDISFKICLYKSFLEELRQSEEPVRGAGIDRTKPFYIRVNGANWSSTRVREVVANGNGEDATMDLWTGEIFGLTALSNYYCEFVRSLDDKVICATSLITSLAPCAEQVVSPRQSLRPSSPTTTLKNSIAAAERDLQDQRNRLKRNRKEHKSHLASIRKEVDSLSSRLSSSSGGDERQKQRALQFSQNIKQMEEAAVDLQAQIELLGDIPDDERNEAAKIKRDWQQERDLHETASAEFDRCKAEGERELTSVQNDIATIIQKRERLLIRQSKLNEQQDRLLLAAAQDINALAKKHEAHATIMAQRSAQEQQYINMINSYEVQIVEMNAKQAQLLQQLQHLESHFQQQQQQQQQRQQHSVPTTPEGHLPGTGHRTIPANFHFPALNAPISGTPGSRRGRSSSMLSGISGFTDDLEDPPVAPGFPINGPFGGDIPGTTRKGSTGSGSGNVNGSGSGSGSANDSQRDPLSPVPKSVVGAQPVGSPLGPAVGNNP